MVANGFGGRASDADCLVVAEKRPDEMAYTVASVVTEPADEAGAREANGFSPLRPDEQSVAVTAEGDDHGEEDADGATDIKQPEANEADAANRTDEGTAAAEATDEGGQPDSGTSPDDALGDQAEAAPDGAGDESDPPQPAPAGDLPKPAEDVVSGSAILGPSQTTIEDLEDFDGELDADAYRDMFPEASAEDDAALLAHARNVDEVIVDATPEGRILDKARTFRAVDGLGKRVKVRVHHGLTREQEKERRYQLNAGGRQLLPEQTQKIRRDRVWNLFRLRNTLNLRISIEEIARQTGYSKSWISKLEEQFLASNSSSGGEAVKRNLNRKKTAELVEKARSLHAAGKSIDEIAKEIGVSPNTIRNWLKAPSPKASEPKAAADVPPAGKGGATGTSSITTRKNKPIQPPAVLTDLGFDIDDCELVDRALEQLDGAADLKMVWREAGRQLVTERQGCCPADGLESLKAAAQADVELRAAAAAARKWLEELLRTKPQRVA
jgi:transcriptional regulator with XRE-family HTH domain